MGTVERNLFFTNLKETVSVINKVVSEVTAISSEYPSESCYSEIYEEHAKKTNDIILMQKEAIKIKEELAHKCTYFGNYFHDIQELVLEIEDNVNSEEKFLQKYGLDPLKIAETVPIVETIVPKTPPSEHKIRKCSKTPSIYDYIDVKQIDRLSSRETNSADKNEGSAKTANILESMNGTPKLILDPTLRQFKSPVVPSIVTNEESYIEENTELPPLPPSHVHLENSVVSCDSISDTSYGAFSLGPIVRKLNF